MCEPPVAAEYGLYVGAVGAVCAVVCSLWAVGAALTTGPATR